MSGVVSSWLKQLCGSLPLEWQPSAAVLASLHHLLRFAVAFLLFWLAIATVWYLAWKLVLSKIPLFREIAGLESKEKASKRKAGTRPQQNMQTSVSKTRAKDGLVTSSSGIQQRTVRLANQQGQSEQDG
eukprot:gb/GEZN01014903.1/.p1 GENE.gb/GEZN01014903.1/~~gb/GEZN01014903.1/.p1  ORF type:complete len:129 (+),score=16.35 gb/GEZN01014903.1/:53-439(+)